MHDFLNANEMHIFFKIFIFIKFIIIITIFLNTFTPKLLILLFSY